MQKVKVSISVTYSKSSEVLVDDNYSDLDLRNAVREQCHLPNEILLPLAEVAKVKPSIVYPNFKPDVFEGWVEDDFEVVKDI